ncbi:unknown protein [Seminavis robusta]|uniref:Uncharacterized protein n=1 Tax=Seminavis robusta TaxID=568900 RepID=A0A9N8EJX5_9STRA|nr:unknown protein [Seminavis robusta]|eukprot:Sro1198_g251610.1 n/a (448) ;mRNA; r:5689-7032
MDAAQISALVTAAVQAALQNQDVINAIRPPARVIPAVPFAVTPAGAGNDAWDFTTSTGLKIFMASTAPLPVLYDGKEAGLRDFLRKILQRAQSYGWSSILMVADTAGNVKNITTQHGSLNLTNVQAHATTYLRAQQRQHQASACLSKLIMGSITPKLANRLATRSNNYNLNVAVIPPAPHAAPAPIIKEDGTCMLYELISMVSIETIATVAILNKKLINLEHIMEQSKSNIEDFNFVVDDLIAQLDARSVAPPPMIHSLFDGYANCADPEFTKYIAFKLMCYEDGTIQLDYESLMHMAAEKYKSLVRKDKWMHKSEEQLEIIALRSEISDLKAMPSVQAASANKNSEKKDQKKVSYADKFAWKLVEPKSGEPKEKTVNNKTYIYCPYHDTTKWVLKVNDKGVDHRTGCTKKKEALAAAAINKEEDTTAAALAGAMEDVGTATVDVNP